MHAILLDMDVSAPPRIRPLRRAEYDKLIELGEFQDERIELLEGALVVMSPIGPPHTSTVQKLTAFFVVALQGRASVRIQSPFAADDVSEPEPDVVVAPLGEYDTEHPSRAYLIIEVAESSLRQDRGLKRRLYAQCGVPEYWIVNLVEHCVEVNLEPENGRYRKTACYARGESIHPVCFPDLEVRVLDIMK